MANETRPCNSLQLVFGRPPSPQIQKVVADIDLEYLLDD